MSDVARVLVQHDTDLWSAEYELAWQGGLVPIPVRMTVIRLASGELVVHSPGPMSSGLRAELDALGRVAFIVSPQAHGRFAPQAARSYASAQLLHGPAPLDPPPAAWSGQVDTYLVQGFRLDEVVLFHRPSRTLVITDLCFNIQRSSSRVARAFFRANGMWRRFGPSRLIRLLAVSDRAALRRALEHILEWNFDRIVPGHGDVLEHGGPAALRVAWM